MTAQELTIQKLTALGFDVRLSKYAAPTIDITRSCGHNYECTFAGNTVSLKTVEAYDYEGFVLSLMDSPCSRCWAAHVRSDRARRAAATRKRNAARTA